MRADSCKESSSEAPASAENHEGEKLPGGKEGYSQKAILA